MRTLTTFLIAGITLAVILILYTPSPAECRPADENPASPFNPLALMESLGMAPNKKKEKDNGLGGFGRALQELAKKDKKEKKKKKGKKSKKEESEDSDDSDDSDSDDE